MKPEVIYFHHDAFREQHKYLAHELGRRFAETLMAMNLPEMNVLAGTRLQVDIFREPTPQGDHEKLIMRVEKWSKNDGPEL